MTFYWVCVRIDNKQVTMLLTLNNVLSIVHLSTVNFNHHLMTNRTLVL